MAVTSPNVCDHIQQSIGWCEGKPQYAGIRRRLYYLSRGSILKYPEVPLDTIGRPTSATLAGSFETKESAVWLFIDIVPERSQATSAPQGEYPSQTSLDKIVGVHPGVGPEAAAAAAYCHNTDNCYLMVDSDGRARVIGIEEMWKTKSTVEMDFGQGASGTASTTITVEGTNKVPFPQYVGKIMTEDGEIDFSKN